jgi:hypothetical protein
MHYGVPIVTGPDFSLKEIAGDAACFVDPRKPESIADALLKVSRDASLREALRCRGKERLGFFDLAIETRKLLEAWSACVGRKEGFPRKSTVLEAKAVLALPTPASDALWTLEVRVNPQFPQNRYAFYLDDAAQGSFSCSQNGSSVFHFDCRPGSRVLRVVITRDRTVPGISLPVSQGAIEAVVFKRPEGLCFALFEKKEGGAL